VTGSIDLPADLSEADGDPCLYRLENLWLDGELTLSNARLELAGSGVRLARVDTEGAGHPVLEARNSLLGGLQVPLGTTRLLFCTVLGALETRRIEVSDCILAGPLRGAAGQGLPETGCLRYSRVPDQVFSPVDLYSSTCPRSVPRFFSETFGQPGCGVLHPAAAEALRQGAEDGGELGAYHDRHYSLRLEAALEKLASFLPAGMEAVWVPDPTLGCPPPGVAAA
jgi:hypothetical protein